MTHLHGEAAAAAALEPQHLVRGAVGRVHCASKITRSHSAHPGTGALGPCQSGKQTTPRKDDGRRQKTVRYEGYNIHAMKTQHRSLKGYAQNQETDADSQ